MSPLLIDLDGTLSDPADGITLCLQYALEKLGRTPPAREKLLRFIGPPLLDNMLELLGEEKLAQKGVELDRARFSTKGLFENRVYPGIPETLSALRQRGHELYVATSKPQVFAERVLDHFGLRDSFAGVYGPELDGTRNHKPELIAYALEREALDPAETWMIGDRLHDIRGARANGLRSIGVLWGFGSREELLDAGATALVAQPEEILDVVEA